MSDKKRKKIVMEVNEMTEVDAQVISLVKHAANRSPFKILKKQKDGTMHLNLKTLFKKAEPEVIPGVSVLIVKSEKAPALAAMITGKGIQIIKQEDLDGATTLHLTDDIADTIIFKMSDDVAVGVMGIKKSFSSWLETDSFVKSMAISGFFPGVRVAADVYLDTLGNIMYKSEAGSPPTQQVSKLNDDFSRYVNDLVSKIPVEAFKYEGMVFKEEGAVVTEAAGDTPAGDTITTTELIPTGGTTPVAAITETVADTKAAAGGATEQVQDTPVPKAASEVTKAEVESLITAQVATGLETINKSVADVLKKNEDAMAALMLKFETLTTTLKGVVNFETPGDLIQKEETTKPKSEFDNILKFEGFEQE